VFDPASAGRFGFFAAPAGAARSGSFAQPSSPHCDGCSRRHSAEGLRAAHFSPPHSAAGTGATSGSGGTGTTSCCDCDGDDVDAMGACGGTDCDDTNDLVYPGQTTYYTTPNDNGFDYDCNDEPDPFPEWATAVKCGLVGLPCSKAGTGFLDTVPACGQKGDFGQCAGMFIPCSNQVLEIDKIMKCK